MIEIANAGIHLVVAVWHIILARAEVDQIHFRNPRTMLMSKFMDTYLAQIKAPSFSIVTGRKAAMMAQTQNCW